MGNRYGHRARFRVASLLLSYGAMALIGCIEGVPGTPTEGGPDQPSVDRPAVAVLHDFTVDTSSGDSTLDARRPDTSLDAGWGDTTVDSVPPPPPAVNLCASGWCLEGVNEGGWPLLDLQGVWASSPTDVVVVGGGGHIAHFDGTGWSAKSSPARVSLNQVHGTSATDIFAVGDEGTILHYNGTSWLEHSYSGTLASSNFQDVYSWAPGQFVTAGTNGYIAFWASGDFVDYTQIDATDFHAVGGTSSTDLLAGGASGVLYTCGDRVSWEETTTPVWGTTAVSAIENRGDGIVLLSAGSSIYRRAGLSWVIDDDDANRAWVYDIWGSGADDAWAIGENGEIWRSDGTDWSLAASGAGDSMRDGFATSRDFGIVVGNYGKVTSWDGSRLLEMFPNAGSSSAHHLADVWATSTTEAFLVGALPTGIAALKRTAQGYEQMAAPTASFDKTLRSIWGSSATDLWAVGDAGTILHFDGSVWSYPRGTGFTASFRGVWGRSASDVWAVGSGNTTHHYDGSSWRFVPAPVATGLLGVGGDATRTFAVGNSGVVLRLEGTSWVDDGPTGSSSSFRAVWAADGEDPLIGGVGGMRRRTAPNTWVSVAVPAGLAGAIQDIHGPPTRIIAVGGSTIAETSTKLYNFSTRRGQRVLPGATAVWATNDTMIVTDSRATTLLQTP